MMLNPAAHIGSFIKSKKTVTYKQFAFSHCGSTCFQTGCEPVVRAEWMLTTQTSLLIDMPGIRWRALAALRRPVSPKRRQIFLHYALFSCCFSSTVGLLWYRLWGCSAHLWVFTTVCFCALSVCIDMRLNVRWQPLSQLLPSLKTLRAQSILPPSAPEHKPCSHSLTEAEGKHQRHPDTCV